MDMNAHTDRAPDALAADRTPTLPPVFGERGGAAVDAAWVAVAWALLGVAVLTAVAGVLVLFVLATEAP